MTILAIGGLLMGTILHKPWPIVPILWALGEIVCQLFGLVQKGILLIGPKA